MRSICLLVLLVSATASANAADERQLFYGAWGTAQQCARAAIKPGGTVLAEPFEISSKWLKHGQFICRLNWFPIEERKDGLATGAYAQCGEDSIRDYRLGMTITGDVLTIRWNFALSSPLTRCPAS